MRKVLLWDELEEAGARGRELVHDGLQLVTVRLRLQLPLHPLLQDDLNPVQQCPRSCKWLHLQGAERLLHLRLLQGVREQLLPRANVEQPPQGHRCELGRQPLPLGHVQDILDAYRRILELVQQILQVLLLKVRSVVPVVAGLALEDLQELGCGLCQGLEGGRLELAPLPDHAPLREEEEVILVQFVDDLHTVEHVLRARASFQIHLGHEQVQRLSIRTARHNHTAALRGSGEGFVYGRLGLAMLLRLGSLGGGQSGGGIHFRIHWCGPWSEGAIIKSNLCCRGSRRHPKVLQALQHAPAALCPR
mmetsp:Transcript_100522/g.322597  ORF Transcript_100522/g.322597 Transcript_100522/m.322597 type:complete len:305 (-) Transcript_100522:7481-8395(-)